jgi:hypothetical protein
VLPSRLRNVALRRRGGAKGKVAENALGRRRLDEDEHRVCLPADVLGGLPFEDHLVVNELAHRKAIPFVAELDRENSAGLDAFTNRLRRDAAEHRGNLFGRQCTAGLPEELPLRLDAAGDGPGQGIESIDGAAAHRGIRETGGEGADVGRRRHGFLKTVTIGVAMYALEAAQRAGEEYLADRIASGEAAQRGGDRRGSGSAVGRFGVRHA